MLPSESEARHFTLGAPIVSPPWATADLLKKSVEYLRWKLPDHTFSLRWIELGKIENELVQGKIDLAVLPSFPLNPAAPSVGRILASVRTSDAPDPDAGAGCLILTRKNLNAEELANARFGAESSLSVPGYLACAQELVRLGIPVTLIESRTKFFGDLEARRILRSLGKGEIDAAFLRAGLAEDTERANGRRILDGFTVMRPKKDALRAVHSSEVFPAPTLISGTAIPSETQHRILTTLLTMPPDGYGAQWTIPAQSTAVNRLTRDLEIEPYEYLRHWTLSRIWKEYRAGVLLAAVILFSMLCHGWLLEKLVRQLRKALADQLAAEKLAALKSEELKRTERKAVVAQLSSIFAHEISSPLSALQNLVRGVRLSIDRRLEI